MENTMIVVTGATGSHVVNSEQAAQVVGQEVVNEMVENVRFSVCPFEIRKVNGATIQVSRFGQPETR